MHSLVRKSSFSKAQWASRNRPHNRPVFLGHQTMVSVACVRSRQRSLLKVHLSLGSIVGHVCSAAADRSSGQAARWPTRLIHHRRRWHANIHRRPTDRAPPQRTLRQPRRARQATGVSDRRRAARLTARPLRAPSADATADRCRLVRINYGVGRVAETVGTAKRTLVSVDDADTFP